MGQKPFKPAPNSLENKTILITGGTTGLGLASAKQLAGAGATVILTARSESKGQAAVQNVLDYLKENGIDNNRVSFQVLDLDDLASVGKASDWDIPELDVILNNAGVMNIPTRELTVNGVERQMQSNHLGHFLLVAKLFPKIKNTARIINVSSESHRLASKGMLFDYMWKGEPDYGPHKSYAQSKLANILFTTELQKRAIAAGLDWTVVSIHPGIVSTDITRQNDFGTKVFVTVMSPFLSSAEQGASTQVMIAAAAEKEGEDVRGKYYSSCKPHKPSAHAKDEAAAARLWEESEKLIGMKFELDKKTVAK